MDTQPSFKVGTSLEDRVVVCPDHLDGPLAFSFGRVDPRIVVLR